MSTYKVIFYFEGAKIFETTIDHDMAYKALLFAESQFKTVLKNAEFDQIEIKELDHLDESK